MSEGDLLEPQSVTKPHRKKKWVGSTSKWAQPFEVIARLQILRHRSSGMRGSLYEACHFARNKRVIGKVHVLFPDYLPAPPFDTLIEITGLVKSKINREEEADIPYVLLCVETWKLASGEGTGIPSGQPEIKWQGLPADEEAA